MQPTTPFPFARYRRIRFGDTRRRPCPHCHNTHVHRWGSFSGRRRYRCVACRRTFSDFTGTPLAHLVHIDRWIAFCDCICASLSVRRTAHHLGVDKSTAFRWRHRLLRHLDRTDIGPLESPLLIHEASFPFSEKGKRGLDRPPERRPPWARSDTPPAWAFIARDGHGRVATGFVGRHRPRASDLVENLHHRLDTWAQVVSSIGPYGATGLLAVRTDRLYWRTGTGAPEFVAIQRYIHCLRGWLRPFRGVATRYLANYLAWHRILTLAERARPGAPLRWLLAARFP